MSTVYILTENGKIKGVVSSTRKALNFLVEGKARNVEQFSINEISTKNELPNRRRRAS